MFLRKRTSHNSGTSLSHPVLRVAVWLCLFLCVPVGATWAADQIPPYEMGGGQVLTIDLDGSLVLMGPQLETPLLGGRLGPLADGRRRRGETALPTARFFLAHEGQAGGLRGFSARADDDQDGLVDEDPLDGRDNDGDGRKDEDFAAISDRLTALDLVQGRGRAHLEFMHWDGSRLQGAMFLSASATHELGDGIIPRYHLETPGTPWEEAGMRLVGHDLQGASRPFADTAFLSRVEYLHESEAGTAPSSLAHEPTRRVVWLGVMVLNPQRSGPGQRQLRPQLSDDGLWLPLSDEDLDLVICTAPSWVQLNRLLMDAGRVYAGVTDPVTERTAPWIVPPLCARCRLEKRVDYQAVLHEQGGLDLEFHLEPGLSCLLDPDQFRLAGFDLGRPDEIRWQAFDGAPVVVDWAGKHPDLEGPAARDGLSLWDELGLDGSHEAEGNLIFHFVNPAGKEGLLAGGKESPELHGVWLDGRAFVATGDLVSPLALEERFPRTAGRADGSAEETARGQDRLMLSATLLEGWPNPFQDRITLEFEVPSTVGETFDWSRVETLPEGLDKAAPMAWSSGLPSLSVKIYSINGQELVSLQEGSFGPGSYTVGWDGTDASGRHLASGTYFCKLQLDDYSVTRRLVFLR